ncbi:MULTISPECIES: Crp/Fnr family transcriptional regulator [Hyphomicrobiales]|uniref:Crp/Fnr family transcriptional regulator n=1 Tax=Hyphomicrobiales TaxID=356 RepID=UPI003265DD92
MVRAVQLNRCISRRTTTIIPLRDCDSCGIRTASICSVLTHADLRRFETLGQKVVLRPRAQLFSEDRPADAVFTVTTGVTRLYRLLPNGSRQVVGFGLPGDFLGLPLRERYGFSADAAEFMTACRFSRQSFLDFMEGRPVLMRRVYEATVRSLELAHDQMMLLGRCDARTKIAAFLIGMNARRAHTGSVSATVPLPMGRQDIGDFLGLSIATVSRTLGRLAGEGLIMVIPKGVRVLDRPRLERVAGGHAAGPIPPQAVRSGSR